MKVRRVWHWETQLFALLLTVWFKAQTSGLILQKTQTALNDYTADDWILIDHLSARQIVWLIDYLFSPSSNIDYPNIIVLPSFLLLNSLSSTEVATPAVRGDYVLATVATK